MILIDVHTKNGNILTVSYLSLLVYCIVLYCLLLFLKVLRNLVFCLWIGILLTHNQCQGAKILSKIFLQGPHTAHSRYCRGSERGAGSILQPRQVSNPSVVQPRRVSSSSSEQSFSSPAFTG